MGRGVLCLDFVSGVWVRVCLRLCLGAVISLTISSGFLLMQLSVSFSPHLFSVHFSTSFSLFCGEFGIMAGRGDHRGRGWGDVGMGMFRHFPAFTVSCWVQVAGLVVDRTDLVGLAGEWAGRRGSGGEGTGRGRGVGGGGRTTEPGEEGWRREDGRMGG
ncbi:hypothetical protein BZA05DRAFT_253812 [Tricharina praecox]|uniref:uncharacterized protein n=1 Tax=Tricharina praecox TaxID=43433 RepID=UPI00221F8BA4|nr:uncharacterized protein BZA05DRAFT_253812 [Tricharina praecox]KAI5854933.1 hypothetical protein BZA05DRAFT_253812 [Tricharina praecox]